MELRRKALKPIKSGQLVVVGDNERFELLRTKSYAEEGNVEEKSRNPEGKIHVADVRYLYCTNASPFNSKKNIEVIPITFIPDGHYGDGSYSIASKKRMKWIMPKKLFKAVHNRNSIVNKNNVDWRVQSMCKKHKLETHLWEHYLEGN